MIQLRTNSLWTVARLARVFPEVQEWSEGYQCLCEDPDEVETATHIVLSCARWDHIRPDFTALLEAEVPPRD
jgi:hypothetical protein